jgi:hypothetical protein
MEEKTKDYLKGYREGFESALKIAWAYAEQLLIEVDNSSKDNVRKLIDKLKN